MNVSVYMVRIVMPWFSVCRTYVKMQLKMLNASSMVMLLLMHRICQACIGGSIRIMPSMMYHIMPHTCRREWKCDAVADLPGSVLLVQEGIEVQG